MVCFLVKTIRQPRYVVFPKAKESTGRARQAKIRTSDAF